MAADYRPGEIVLHPLGPSKVIGVQHEASAGDCLAIAPIGSRSGVIKIPLHRVPGLAMRVLAPAEAQHELDRMRAAEASARRRNFGSRMR
jgi:hypothetical protein